MSGNLSYAPRIYLSIYLSIYLRWSFNKKEESIDQSMKVIQ